jgi:hypothetical protein
MAGGWRELHNQELRSLNSSPSIIRMIRSKEDDMGRECSTHGAKRIARQVFGGKARKEETTGKN